MFVQLQKDFLGRRTGERIDVSEQDAQSLISQGLAMAVTEDLITPAVSKALESAFGKFTQALDGIVEQSLKQFANVQTQGSRHAVPAIFGAGRGDPNLSFGDWLLAVRRGDRKYLADRYNSHPAEWEQKTALSAGGGTTGGYTVPTDFLPALLSAASEQSVVRPRAMMVPMTSRSIQVPYLDITQTPTAGNSAYFGGLVANWTEEAASMTETEPAFRQLELVAHELSGYSLVSNALLADNAVGLEALLIKLFGSAIAWFEDYAFLRGDGVGKPLGVSSAPAAVSVSRNTANNFKLVDAGTMLGKLLPGWSAKSACWVLHPSVIQQVVQMVSAAAGVGWLDNLRDKLPMQLLGLPICISEKLPALGTAKDVLLCDFQHYLIGDRRQVEIAYSEHFRFTNNQAAWRFVARVDGQPWLRSAVTLSNASSTVSPFVYLS